MVTWVSRADNAALLDAKRGTYGMNGRRVATGPSLGSGTAQAGRYATWPILACLAIRPDWLFGLSADGR